jgi:hypothetical protein
MYIFKDIMSLIPIVKLQKNIKKNIKLKNSSKDSKLIVYDVVT